MENNETIWFVRGVMNSWGDIWLSSGFFRTALSNFPRLPLENIPFTEWHTDSLRQSYSVLLQSSLFLSWNSRDGWPLAFDLILAWADLSLRKLDFLSLFFRAIGCLPIRYPSKSPKHMHSKASQFPEWNTKRLSALKRSKPAFGRLRFPLLFLFY